MFATQRTPEYGGWAFQYVGPHKFDIPDNVDIAMTHGPPQGIRDLAGGSIWRAGCDYLFQGIHQAKRKIHCFGHIHEAWGAYLAQWKEGDEEPARYESVIDESRSRLIRELADPIPWQSRRRQGPAPKMPDQAVLSKQRGVHVDLTPSGDDLKEGEQPLVVNAAIMGITYRPTQLPWIVDVELPATESNKL